MPLFSGVVAPPTGPDDTFIRNPAEDVGTITATWIDPLGGQWPLSTTADSIGWFTRPGVAGWGATSYEIVTDPLARGGESVRFVRAQPARLTWPLHVFGDTHLEFVQRLRALKRAFLMTMHRRTPGILRVMRPDGKGREIEAFYEDGWGGQGGHEDWLFADPVLTLFCPDGYWRDIEPISVYNTYGTLVSYLDPYPTVSESQVLGNTTIANPGDVVAWPVWRIDGPAEQIVATNHSTGEAFTLTHTLMAGEYITITTQRPTIRDGTGANLAAALNWPSAVLWGLLPGDNSIEYSVTGATTGSRITLNFYARYDGA